MRITLLLLTSILIASLSSCAGSGYQKVPMPPQDIPVSKGDVCRVYVLRDSSMRGSTRNVRVLDGDFEIGTIEADEYLCWERQPGRTLLKLYYEGVAIGVGETEGLVDLRGEAGHRYVYSITLSYPDRKEQAELLSDKDAIPALAGRKPAPVK